MITTGSLSINCCRYSRGGCSIIQDKLVLYTCAGGCARDAISLKVKHMKDVRAAAELQLFYSWAHEQSICCAN